MLIMASVATKAGTRKLATSTPLTAFRPAPTATPMIAATQTGTPESISA